MLTSTSHSSPYSNSPTKQRPTKQSAKTNHVQQLDTSNQTNDFRNVVKGEAIAGVVSSWVTAISLCPFDVLKTRLQAHPHSQSLTHTTRHILQNEGALALWRGLGPSLLLAVPSKAVYFPCYRTIKNSLDKQFPTTSPLIAGMAARSLTAFLTCPIEYVRTNAQASSAGTPVYAQAFKVPPSRLWTGVGAMILRDAPFSALLWFGYETLNPKLSDVMPSPCLAHLTAGSLAGIFGATLTIPFDVIKTRMQAGGQQRSFTSALQMTMATQGVRGLFCGLTPRLLKIAPGFGLMMLVYERTRSFVGNLPQGNPAATVSSQATACGPDPSLFGLSETSSRHQLHK